MGSIPIIQKDQSCLGQGNDTLPIWYMADYSVMAIVVDQLEAAAHILEEKGFPVLQDNGRKTVVFDNTAGLHHIVALLRDQAIECSLTDSVSQIYQG